MHRLNDGQVKHSPEVFYAGSLWKVLEYHFFIMFICAHGCFEASNHLCHVLICWILQVTVQAFSDEDPQGRRTLGNAPTS